MSNNITNLEFSPFVLTVLEKYENNYKKSLEDYLLSLWVVIEKHKTHSPSYSLFLTMIDEAFTTQPCLFDEAWLEYKKSLSWDLENDFYIIREYKNDEWVIIMNNVNDFEILKHTILFQIADLHRMPIEKLNDPYRYFGIISSTGASWYSFTPFDFWECATRGMEDHLNSPSSLMAHHFNKLSWAVLAALLELGQMYE